MASIRPMMLEDLLHFNAAWLQKQLHEPRPKFTSSVRITLMGITIMFASLLHLKISHCCHCNVIAEILGGESGCLHRDLQHELLLQLSHSMARVLCCNLMNHCETSVPLFVCVRVCQHFVPFLLC